MEPQNPPEAPAPIQVVIAVFALSATFGGLMGCCVAAPLSWGDITAVILSFQPITASIALGVCAIYLANGKRWAWRASIVLSAVLGTLFLLLALIMLGGGAGLAALIPGVIGSTFVGCVFLLTSPTARAWLPDPHTGLWPHEQATRTTDEQRSL